MSKLTGAASNLAKLPAAFAVLVTSACTDPTSAPRAEWRECVKEAFRAESAQIGRSERAAEVAFQTCQAKEDVLFKKAAESNPDVYRARNDLRQREKARLLKQG